MSNISPAPEESSDTVCVNHQLSEAPSSISSGYESPNETHGLVTPYLLPSSFNPLMIRQPVNIGTNAQLLQDQYNSLLPGQPYTAPVMVVTQEQLDYHAFVQQQMNDQSHDRSHDHRQRQYSGPVIIASTHQNPITSSPQLLNHNFHSGLQNSNANPSNAQHGSYQPPLLQMNSVVLPGASNNQSDFKSLQVTQSLSNFEQKPSEHKSLRRNTSPNVGNTENQRRDQQLKRSSLSMKEKSLCEEEEEGTSSLLVGEDFGGYDYQFLVSSDDLQDITCPICQLVLCVPFLTTCCGAHFCRDCVAPLLRKKSPCPLCNNTTLQGIIDRRTERRINSLPVHCTKYDIGCTWTGSLTELHNHLSPSSGNCGYVIIPCPLECGEEHPLSEIKRHQEETCLRRVHPCKFCNHKGIYEQIPQFHWPICEGYPVPCPHNCSVNDMPRKMLNHHLSECPKRNVQCCFSYAGCSTSLQGDEIQQHMDDNLTTHLNLLSGMVRKLLTGWEYQQRPPPDASVKTDKERSTEIIILNRKLNEKEEEIASLKGQMAALQDDSDETKLDVARMKSILYNPPFEFKLTNFTELKDAPNQWFSTPFYTHNNGYKMCMSVDCNGADEGEGTHVSVYANLMRGEFDDSLTWPFCGIITVQLYNQYSDKAHIVHDIPFRKSVPVEISGRVVDQELAESGLGVPQFITHGRLHYDMHTSIGYLKDDQLKFCVLKVKLIF